MYSFSFQLLGINFLYGSMRKLAFVAIQFCDTLCFLVSVAHVEAGGETQWKFEQRDDMIVIQ